MFDSGIYIVTLANPHPISVNAHDRRIAERCIKVTLANCKIGKATSFRVRERNYWRTFGRDYVVFRPIALMPNPQTAERAILLALMEWRIRAQSGRLTEWLEGIAAADAVEIAIKTICSARIRHLLPVHDQPFDPD